MKTLTATIYPGEPRRWLVAYDPETGTAIQGKTVEQALRSLNWDPYTRTTTTLEVLDSNGKEVDTIKYTVEIGADYTGNITVANP